MTSDFRNWLPYLESKTGKVKGEGGVDEPLAQTVRIFLGNYLNSRELFNIPSHVLAHLAREVVFPSLR